MKDTITKYVAFLDIDGVFTSNRVHLSFDTKDVIWTKFDPIAIEFMNYLDSLVELEFVLISTWSHNLPSLIDLTQDAFYSHWALTCFRNSGFRGNFNDCFSVYNTVDFVGNRELAIKVFLEKFDQFEDYLIFDDTDYKFNEVLGKKRFIKTSTENGLLAKNMLDALSIVGQWDKK